MIDSEMQSNASGSSDENVFVREVKSVIKLKKTGRMTEVAEKLGANFFETGEDCRCKRYECSKNISDEKEKP